MLQNRRTIKLLNHAVGSKLISQEIAVKTPQLNTTHVPSQEPGLSPGHGKRFTWLTAVRHSASDPSTGRSSPPFIGFGGGVASSPRHWRAMSDEWWSMNSSPTSDEAMCDKLRVKRGLITSSPMNDEWWIRHWRPTKDEWRVMRRWNIPVNYEKDGILPTALQ